MFNKKETITPLQLLASLIKKKYGIEGVEIRDTNNNDNKVSVVLLNGLSGVDKPEVDGCNTRPIEFLKAHNAEVTKEAHEHHTYWSYSVITFNKEDIKPIVDGLNLLPSADNDTRPRMMARC